MSTYSGTRSRVHHQSLLTQFWLEACQWDQIFKSHMMTSLCLINRGSVTDANNTSKVLSGTINTILTVGGA